MDKLNYSVCMGGRDYTHSDCRYKWEGKVEQDQESLMVSTFTCTHSWQRRVVSRCIHALHLMALGVFPTADNQDAM